VKTNSVIRALTDWECVAFDNEPAFLEAFCPGDCWQLIGVSWFSEGMKIVYVTNEGQHISDAIPMSQWLEFADRHRQKSS